MNWHVAQGRSASGGFIILDENDRYVAETLTKSEATLIAAVPQMKQTLELLLDSLQFHHPTMFYSINQIKQVLKRTEGE